MKRVFVNMKIKRILPLVLALMLVFGSCLTVSAQDSLPVFHDSNYPYCLILKKASTGEPLYIFYISKKPVVSYEEYYYIDEPVLICEGSYETMLSTKSASGEWSEFKYQKHTTTGNLAVFSAGYELYSSNFDVLKKDGTVFFRKPSPLITVAETVKAEEILAPIIGLLPLLILFLAGLVGFWKGWQFLLGKLRRV